jgi:serine/threonine-protein kinase HipA
MPENEHVTMRMADSYGIRVVPSSLIRLASGQISYITKRIDRTKKGEKIHMIDMFQITEAFDKYKSSMEKVGKALISYSGNTLLDALFYFELSLFSFLTGNNDMHLKNFSMTESNSGWVLAPAYDLLNASVLNPDDQEELALTLAGKKRNLKQHHFFQFGKGMGLTDRQISSVFRRLQKNTPEALKWLNKSFLSAGMKNGYMEVLEKRFKQLGLELKN